MMKLFNPRGLLIAAALVATVVANTLSAQEIEFGPNLRSMDFADVFDSSVEARASMWNKFHANGLRRIVISQALVSPFAPDHSRRPDGTYLSDGDLANLRRTLNRGASAADDFRVTYVAGYGLGVSGCAPGADPAQTANAAAEWEFRRIVRRVLDAGVPIRAIDVDGPFLRLLDGSRKAYSCAETATGRGYSDRGAARVALLYMKRLRDLTNAHATNRAAGVTVDMALLVNLPNWAAGRHSALKTAGKTTDVMTGVLSELKLAMEADKDRPLALSGAVVDYPYNHAKADPAAFRAKTAALLEILKTLPRTRAKLTIVTNTNYALYPGLDMPRYRKYRGTVRCVWQDNWQISGGSLPYLPYENARGRKMPRDCVSEQNAADARYWDESVAFARNIASGRWRSESVALGDIAAFRFTSWHEMPVSTLSTMNRTLRFKLYGK
ncbi:hypothetical protein Ga0080574_TMP1067 [Salipiger abyssi]|uniref:Uncharacterized protein n=2 Tax=Salipiger abyssi TaxID=1250539 RepID=A0A1P8UPV2_9RHOB|nr:hypothetical protein Ga0080574_TMP1067 [Salipiger abyssi]